MSGPIYPSTLRYKDRLDCGKDDAFTYNRLYTATQGSDVWARLTVDASVRQSSARSRGSFQEGQAMVRHSFKNSGFDSNTCPAVLTHSTFKAGLYSYGVPIEEQHPITARRFKQKQPLEFMTQIRPHTETTNQALRMLGTYVSDQPHADRLGMFIPAGCPGGKPAYHPDVTTGGFGLLPTLPRRGMGATLTDGRNLK
ncbi:hypothetical protein CHLRE_02g144450v5 [Chlamydomonas reinhardtii]|uniref:Uncharacterized protein n=1 Tax=Chlamydomonas reinhardtii TaxID=3055 RepID=A8J0T8_CHLRE|nr:uncharacterized protein CHLRE_02g144450v5 [Chlamydomonas reinhardtii]8GLV_zt Chain zt, FAP1 [Chlamydomonas reinhardtii]8GLV_zu Chain zu, FAP1 [Chlamydomonas reinhardtii]8GLV_zv Chain zv, FAP1 [Chlamydomonas reinhardtii]8GLV_zw Chain zw, FAP1 [Chlamydomonas reinhardtii]8GLV_zx Chain zx, FAP1 [Chlamydomonas reinhardtii]8GLV_zy Chain zy, FAP1 [Chlamydomonas reinhardtii]8GLV_zz Chain zz, FAP1 [Chlamydomonas reinhardtii]PNW87469.1 hypothetical protein CHLRE_02g144450v5 [Chlamydomonas reinhard|eukprot:XP_001694870.1 flagellar associated protein [Chlamydomonas reinhardtii]